MTTKVQHIILEAVTDEDFKSLFPILHELHPHITSEQKLLEMLRPMVDIEGCHFLYINDILEGETKAKPVSVANYRISHCLFYGTFMYIMDVITVSSTRKKGYSGALMDKIIEIAKKEKCNVVTLDSGYAKKDAHRFYLNKRFNMTSHGFSLDIKPFGK